MSWFKTHNLRRRLTTLTISVALIFSFLFWLLIYIAEDNIELISLHNWLDSESKSYQLSNYQRVPNPNEFDFYTAQDRLPKWLSQYTQTGFYEHQLGPEDKHFLVSLHPENKQPYYIVFKDDADDYLDPYEKQLHWISGGLGVLAMLLIIGYSLWVLHIFRSSLVEIEKKISCLPPDQPMFQVESELDDIRQLEAQLLEAKNTILSSLQREQEFNQFAAHEIRSPLTVIQGSAELLTELLPNNLQQQATTLRIINASQELKQLVNALLLLGQNQLDDHHNQVVEINEILKALIGQLPQPYQSRIRVSHLGALNVYGPESFLIILFKNLILNAMTHSSKDLRIHIEKDKIRFCNPIDEIAEPEESYGYGLIIIDRICEKMHWRYKKQLTEKQFSVEINFNEPDQSQNRYS